MKIPIKKEPSTLTKNVPGREVNISPEINLRTDPIMPPRKMRLQLTSSAFWAAFHGMIGFRSDTGLIVMADNVREISPRFFGKNQ
jgi:hypothetical protein